jgi:hypothetical protein
MPSPWVRAGPRWLLVALIARLVLAGIYFHYLAELQPENGFRLFHESGDSDDYLRSAENWLRLGTFTADPESAEGTVYRMPAYPMTYAAIRLLLPPDAAKTLLVLVQVVLGGIAAYLGARLAGRFAGAAAFFGTLLVLSGSAFTAVYDVVLLTEGLASSCLLFSVYLVITAPTPTPRWWAFLGGSFFAYTVFLRPYVWPLWIPLVVLLAARAASRRSLLIGAFLLPLAATQGVWIVRNFAATGRFIPFYTAGFSLSAPFRAARDWIVASGNDVVWWRAGTLGEWVFAAPVDARYSLPPYLAASGCDEAKIRAARGAYYEYRAEAEPRARRLAGDRAASLFNECREAYVHGRPFDYHVLAPFRLLGHLVVNAGPVLPLPRFRELSLFSPAFFYKIVQAALYACVMIAGPIGFVFLAWRCDASAWVIAGCGLYGLILFPFVLRTVEPRHLVPFFPYLAIASGVLLARQHEGRASRIGGTARTDAGDRPQRVFSSR